MEKAALFHLEEAHPAYPNFLYFGQRLARVLLDLRLALRVDVSVGEGREVEEGSFGGRFGEEGDFVSLYFEGIWGVRRVCVSHRIIFEFYIL